MITIVEYRDYECVSFRYRTRPVTCCPRLRLVPARRAQCRDRDCAPPGQPHHSHPTAAGRERERGGEGRERGEEERERGEEGRERGGGRQPVYQSIHGIYS